MKKDLEDVLLKTFKISSKDGETVKIFSGGELCVGRKILVRNTVERSIINIYS